MKPWSVFAFREDLDPDRLASDCAEWGLERVILPAAIAEDARFPAALRAHGRELWLNLPIFYAPAFLQEHPGDYASTPAGDRAIHGWLHMACPSSEGFLAARHERFAALLERVEPAVVSLDFLRFFVYWEGVSLDGDPGEIVDGCYCRRCLEAFERLAGERAARDERGRIVPEQRAAWARWKTARITEVAARFAALVRGALPGVPLYVKTIPWLPGELADGLRRVAGQDLQALARLADGLAPMAFSHVLGRDAAWKKAHLDAVARATGKEVLSYVQVESISGGSLPLGRLEQEIAVVLDEGRAPVVFHYEQLAADPARAALVQRHARGGRR